MNFFANLLKLILIVAIIGGIGYGCYALFFKPVSTQNVLSEYESVINSQQNQVIQTSLSLDAENQLNQYSKTLDSTFDEVLLLYNYEIDVLSLLLPEATFGGQSAVMTDVSRWLKEYQEAANKTSDAINTFKSDKDNFGDSPTTSQIKTLNGEFKYIADCLFDQTKILTDINNRLLPYVKGHIYGGDNVAKYNIKFLNIEAVSKQGNTLISVLQSEQGVVGEVFFADCQKLYATFTANKNANFNRIDCVLTDQFVADYSLIDKNAFFYALDKNKYYNEIKDATQKQYVQSVMNYFGFDTTIVGGE